MPRSRQLLPGRRDAADAQPVRALPARRAERTRHARPARPRARALARGARARAAGRSCRRAPTRPGRPDAAPRCRTFRRRSATSADLVLDGGELPGVASTVLDLTALAKHRSTGRSCAQGALPAGRDRKTARVAFARCSTAFVTGGSGFIGGALIEPARRRRAGACARWRAATQRASVVADRGAEAVRGDLDDVAAMTAGARGCDVAFHCAAHLGDWGDRADFERGNVQGTANAARGRAAGRRARASSTSAPRRRCCPASRSSTSTRARRCAPTRRPSTRATKAQAEQVVRAADGDGLETVVVRPRLVWGRGDTTILPALVDAGPPRALRVDRRRARTAPRPRTSTTSSRASSSAPSGRQPARPTSSPTASRSSSASSSPTCWRRRASTAPTARSRRASAARASPAAGEAPVARAAAARPAAASPASPSGSRRRRPRSTSRARAASSATRRCARSTQGASSRGAAVAA